MYLQFMLILHSFVIIRLILHHQIADAVVVARYLGATLVLPDIRGSKPGDKRLVLTVEPHFVYDYRNWIQKRRHQQHPTIQFQNLSST